MLQRRFDLPEAEASLKASYLLGGSVILYPIVSHFVVTHRRMITYTQYRPGL